MIALDEIAVKDKVPDPSVLSTSFALPSEVGNASPEAVKAPVLAVPLTSKLNPEVAVASPIITLPAPLALNVLITTLAGVPRLRLGFTAPPASIAGAVLPARPRLKVTILLPVTAKSSPKVALPSAAIVIASALEATPMVPPSLILISSLKVTIPAEDICIASATLAEPISPSSGTLTPPVNVAASLKVTPPAAAIVIAAASVDVPIVPPSFILISSLNVTTPSDAI